MSIPALEIRGLVKRYGSVLAVDGLSFSVPEGATFGFIGPNGAGKTTTFSVIGGFLQPDAGEVLVRGVSLSFGAPRVGHLVLLPQDADLPKRARVRDELRFLGELGGLSAAEARVRTDQAIASLGLDKLASRRIEALSHGERRKVGIAQTLLQDRELLLLDEPTAGLDPKAAAELRSLLQEISAKRTVIISSHNLAELEALCTHAAMIQKGKLVVSDVMSALKQEGQLATVELTRPVSGAIEFARDLPAMIIGVERATFAADGLGLELVFRATDDAEADRILSEVLAKLLASGAMVRSVNRGKSLEARFMEEVRSSSSAPAGGSAL